MKNCFKRALFSIVHQTNVLLLLYDASIFFHRIFIHFTTQLTDSHCVFDSLKIYLYIHLTFAYRWNIFEKKNFKIFDLKTMFISRSSSFFRWLLLMRHTYMYGIGHIITQTNCQSPHKKKQKKTFCSAGKKLILTENWTTKKLKNKIWILCKLDFEPAM